MCRLGKMLPEGAWQRGRSSGCQALHHSHFPGTKSQALNCSAAPALCSCCTLYNISEITGGTLSPPRHVTNSNTPTKKLQSCYTQLELWGLPWVVHGAHPQTGLPEQVPRAVPSLKQQLCLEAFSEWFLLPNLFLDENMFRQTAWMLEYQ